MGKKIKRATFDTKFTTDFQTTDASRTWAATVFGDSPVKVRYCGHECPHKYKVKTRRDDAGDVYRHAFHIQVFSGERIIIHLYAGGTQADLDRALKMIAQARDGKVDMRLWEPAETFNGYKMVYAFEDSNTWSRHPQLRPCFESGCVLPHHGWRGDLMDDMHQTEVINKPDEFYYVYALKEDGREWEAYMNVEGLDDLAGPAGVRVLENMLNDYRWVQGECDRLNRAVA